MQQAKFSITEPQIELLKDHKYYGFKDKSAMVRSALEDFHQKLKLESLRKSADLYAELYKEDSELQSLTETEISEWPE